MLGSSVRKAAAVDADQRPPLSSIVPKAAAVDADQCHRTSPAALVASNVPKAAAVDADQGTSLPARDCF